MHKFNEYDDSHNILNKWDRERGNCTQSWEWFGQTGLSPLLKTIPFLDLYTNQCAYGCTSNRNNYFQR